MTTKTMPAREAKIHFGQLINLALEQGRVDVTRHGSQTVSVIPTSRLDELLVAERISSEFMEARGSSDVVKSWRRHEAWLRSKDGANGLITVQESKDQRDLEADCHEADK